MANNAFTNITDDQITRALKDGWTIEEARRGYAMVNYQGTGMMQIEFINAMWLNEGDPVVNDEDAALEAARSGYCKIIPVSELPDNFEYKWFGWVDTPENRKAIENYCLDWNEDVREDVYEVCSKCDAEFTVHDWNPRDGFIVKCTECGTVQHLCSQCVWHNNCDWRLVDGISTCRMGKARNTSHEKYACKVSLNRVLKILNDYIDNDLAVYERAYVVDVLHNVCHCDDEEIKAIGLDWLL